MTAAKYWNVELGLARTKCHFGGYRLWFWCPHCWDRAAKLYMRSGRFACRVCNRMRYLVESQDRGQRLWMKAERIERRLGPDLDRLKGMHQKTYHALLARYEAVHRARDQWFDSRLIARFGG